MTDQDLYNNPPTFAVPASNPGGMSSVAVRDAQGRVIKDLENHPLPQTIIDTQAVWVGGAWVPIDPIDMIKANALRQLATGELATPVVRHAWAPPGQSPPPAVVQSPPQVSLPVSLGINPPPVQSAPPGWAAPAFPAPAAAPAAEKKGPGRPKKEASDDEVSGGGRLLLLVDARTVHGTFRGTLDFTRDVLPDVRAKMLAEQQVADYRFLKFGEGSGALSIHVEQRVRSLLAEARGWLPLEIDSTSDEGRVCLPRLVALAERVVQGR